jgi:hypothetical protein
MSRSDLKFALAQLLKRVDGAAALAAQFLDHPRRDARVERRPALRRPAYGLRQFLGRNAFQDVGQRARLPPE